MRGAEAITLALVIGAVAAMPLVVGGTYYTYLGIIVFIYGIVAIGLNILSGYAGQFSLGHAALMAMGAYTTALLTKALAAFPFFAQTGLHIWLGIVCGTIIAALFGIVLAIPALRVRGPYLAMVTIAFGWVVWKILQEWVSVTGGDLGISSIPKPQIGSLRLGTPQFYYVVLALFLAALATQYRLINSHFGMQVRAIKHSEIAVASVGIDVYRLKVVVFAISAAFAGFGGTLFAHQQNYINPDSFQFFSSVFFLLAVLFGGAGTMLGPVIGAAVLTLLPEMLHDFDKYRLIVYGCLILLNSLFSSARRHGLGGAHGEIRRESARPGDAVYRSTDDAASDVRRGIADRRPVTVVRRASRIVRRELSHRRRINSCLDRPEWRRQDNTDQYRVGRVPGRRGPCDRRWIGSKDRFNSCCRAAGHCAYVSDLEDVWRHDRH